MLVDDFDILEVGRALDEGIEKPMGWRGRAMYEHADCPIDVFDGVLRADLYRGHP